MYRSIDSTHIYIHTRRPTPTCAPTDGSATVLLPQKSGPFAFLLPNIKETVGVGDEATDKERAATVHLDFHVCSAVSARSWFGIVGACGRVAGVGAMVLVRGH